MSEIKKGSIVKAWNGSIYSFVIGRVTDDYSTEKHRVFGIKLDDSPNSYFVYRNICEIPEELAKQLEELGK